MNKIKMAVVFGGKSSEYSVSLHSAASLLRNCSEDLYELTLIGITEQGDWYHLGHKDYDRIEHDHWFDDTCEEVYLSLGKEKGLVLRESNKTLPIDVIFPCLHGKNGEDGTIQGYFELAQIPYVGCNVLASSTIMDKEFTHIICESGNIPCSPYICVYQDLYDDEEKWYNTCVEKLGLPIFIKPCNAGSSYGISKIRNYEEFKVGMKLAFEHDTKVLCETAIDGFEIGCAVLGNGHDLIVGECDEIETHKDFFDFKAKYGLEDTQIHCPARLTPEQSAHAKELAKKAYTRLNCSGMTRVDMFVCTDGRIILNELNTIPGFTATSRYPSMMKAAGYSFEEVINKLVKLAMKR